MRCSEHGCGTQGRPRWVRPITVLLGLLLWWPLLPNAATFAHAAHAVAIRADLDGGALGWPEQTPFELNELNEVEDAESKHTTPDPAESCAPDHVLEHGHVRFELRACERSSVPGGHERLERQRGPPIA
jgi:hypothetical protein